jgi:hypothetical protein
LHENLASIFLRGPVSRRPLRAIYPIATSKLSECLRAIECEFVSEHNRSGLEFVYLEGSRRETFARWLERERPSGFIAKEHHGKSSGASP